MLTKVEFRMWLFQKKYAEKRRFVLSKRLLHIAVYLFAATVLPGADANPYLTLDARQLNSSSRRTALILSEIMYHPKAKWGTNSLEYVEIFNTEPVDRDISGYRLSGDIDYTFTEGTILNARSYLVVAHTPEAVRDAYGITDVAGPFTGNLPNSGGDVRLRNGAGALLLEVTYNDKMPWPVAADGAGHSLILSKPDYGEDDVQGWSASRDPGGSPGEMDPLTNRLLDALCINEILDTTYY